MSAESVQRAHVDAFNKADWSAFAATCAPDVVYKETGSNRTVDGVDAFVEMAQGWRASFSDMHGTIQSCVATDSASVLELSWTGTHDGVLDLPTGKFPATGKPFQISEAMVVIVEAGKITRVSCHVDMLSLLLQVGAIPGAEGSA